jgi:hypothetical protein
MRSIRSLLALVTAAVCATMAAPAHTQRIADLAPGAPSYVQPAPVSAAPLLSANRDLPSPPQPSRVDTRDPAAARPLSVAGHTAVGAGAGALTGVLASLAMFAFDPNCRMGDSMCGLAVPVFIGGGTLTGGVVGLVVGLIRSR